MSPTYRRRYVALQQPEHHNLAALAREGASTFDQRLRSDIVRRAVATVVPALSSYLVMLRPGGLPAACTVAFASIVVTQWAQDPAASFEEQCALVAACLDNRIRLLDTTYYQERIALGRVLRELGRRDEATVTGWNFFKQAGKEDELVDWTPYAPHHIDVILRELQTDRIDLLVIHAEDNLAILERGLALVEDWVAAGNIRRVGFGMVGLRHLDQLPAGHPVTHVLAPYNAFNRDAAALFARAASWDCKQSPCHPSSGVGSSTRSAKIQRRSPQFYYAGS